MTTENLSVGGEAVVFSAIRHVRPATMNPPLQNPNCEDGLRETAKAFGYGGWGWSNSSFEVNTEEC